MVKLLNPQTLKGAITLFVFVLLFSFETRAQNEVAIGSTTTKSNAILWLNGNGSQGLILPVVTNKSAVSNPDKGMVVYDDSDNKVWYRSNSAWVEVGSGTGSSTTNLNLLLQGNQLQLRDGTTVQSTVNIAGGTQSNGAFLVFTGGSWQYATLSGDVTGANAALVVNGIKGKTVATLPATPQALVYDPAANSSTGGWIFQPLTSGGTVSNVTGTAPVTVTSPTTTPTISIANGGITNSLLASDAVNASKIQDATITGADIAATTITGGNIAASTITADKLAQSAATTGQVLKWNGTNWVPQIDATGTGTVPTLSNGQLLTGNGTTNSATTLTGDATLSGGAITIGNNAITTAKINGSAVDATKLADNAVTAAKISDGSITGADLASNIAISTTGNVSVNAPGIISGIGSGLTTLNATNISSGSLALARITPGTNGQVLTTVAGVPAWQTSGAGATTLDGLTDATVTAASSGQLLVNDGAGQFRNVSASGDATISNSGAVTLANSVATRINLGLGTLATLSAVDLATGNVTGILPVANGGTGRSTWDGLLLGSAGNISDISTGTAGQFLRVVGTSPSWQTFAVTSTDITDGTITDFDINGTAAIAGTKVNPAFGTQNISTSGTLSAGATTVSGLTIGTSVWPANAVGALTNDGTGSLTWAASGGSSSWGLTGNAGTNPATDFIGTTDAQPLRFATGVGGTERMRIGATGNVGIGTNNPRSKLEIQAGDLILSGSPGTTTNQTDPPDINFVTLANVFKAKIWTDQTTNTLWISTSTTPTSNRHLTLDPSGNFGIGTITPLNILHAQGTLTGTALTTTPVARFANSTLNGNTKVILGSDNATADAFSNFTAGASAATQVLGFGVGNATSTATQLNLTGSGNVGIGTTTPAETLDVNGNTLLRGSFVGIGGATAGIGAAGLVLQDDNGAGGYGGMYINSNATGLPFYGYAQGGVSNTWTYLDGSTWKVYNTGDRIAVTSIGNVGIGIAAPSYRFHTVGDNSGGSVAFIENTNTNLGADGLTIQLNNTASSNDYVYFERTGGLVQGRIAANGSGAVQYLTASDRRLKKNISDFEDGLSMVLDMRTRNYVFKESPEMARVGFIAQELIKIFPEAVNGDENSDSNKEPMMVDYSKLTPILVRAIQQQQAMIESLQKKNEEVGKQLEGAKQIESELNSLKTELAEIKRILGVEAKANKND